MAAVLLITTMMGKQNIFTNGYQHRLGSQKNPWIARKGNKIGYFESVALRNLEMGTE